MAIITLSSAFDTDTFWAARSGLPITASATTYEFENAAGSYVRVTGTGLTYDGDDPDGGVYTAIDVYSDDTFTTLVASYSSSTDVHFATYFTDFQTAALGGADTVTGSNENDTIKTYGGNDTINGGQNDDTVDGGDGSDFYDFSFFDVSSADQVSDTGDDPGDIDSIRPFGSNQTVSFRGLEVGFSGVEALTYTNFNNVVQFAVNFPSEWTVNGNSFRNRIQIDSTPDVDISGWTFTNWSEDDEVFIAGTQQSNHLVGSHVDETIIGGQLDDSLEGGLGNDDLRGGLGIDVAVFSGNLADYVIEVDNGTGFTTITGPDGVDSLNNINLLQFDDITIETPGVVRTGGTGDDSIEGTDGTDTLTGAGGNDTLDGGDGTDDLAGGEGNDALTGGQGNDMLDGGTGADDLNGGDGSDTYVVDDAGDTVTDDPPAMALAMRAQSILALMGDVDTVRSSISYTLGADIERLVLLAGAVNGTGNASGNTITGNTVANFLQGLGGNDTLSGLDGNDTLDGGAGFDTLTGGTGNDTYVVNAGDNIVETAGQGTADRARASASFSLGSGDSIELLETSNAAATTALSLTGNEVANTVTGNAGANTLSGLGGNDALAGLTGRDLLSGGVGNDTLNGGFGADRLTGGTGRDTFVFNVAPNAANRDTITDFSVPFDTIQLENAVFARLAGTGTLSSGQFVRGATAQDANDRIIYNPANGALIYDTNGSAAGGAVHFATLDRNLSLTNADFVIV